MKPIPMPYIEACPKCGATEDTHYSAVDSIGGDTPLTKGEEWHCHKCDKWTRFRFASVLRKMAPKFGFPVQITVGDKKYTAVRMFRAGRSQDQHYITRELHADGYDTRLKPTKADPRIIIVYAAHTGTKGLMKKRQRVAALEKAPKLYGAPQTKAASRAKSRWARKR